MASAPGPKAIAMSPAPETAVALLPTVGNKSVPSMEIWKSRDCAGSAAGNSPLGSIDETTWELSAEATPGVAAIADPIPTPTASMPS
jgi:hypothetical protein